MVSIVTIAMLVFPVAVALADTTTDGGQAQGVQVRAIWKIHQNKYDSATDLHFKLWQKEDNIYVNGWKVDISDFTSSSSQRGNQPSPYHERVDNMPGLPRTNDPDNGQHAVDVTANGANIPRSTWVKVKATFWLTSWNTLRISGVTWTKEADEKKAMPAQGWQIGWPKPDPLNPGNYTHNFTIANDDDTDCITVSGLTFLANECYYENLTNISFPAPYPDFTLCPGENWSTNISTRGPLLGGHIYFKYAIKSSEEVVAEYWLDHPICPSIESSDDGGNRKDIFVEGDSVYASGDGYEENKKYDLYIVDDRTWKDGMAIPPFIVKMTVATDVNGRISPTLIWDSAEIGKYDIIVDANGNEKYDKCEDAIDDMDVNDAGFEAIPEFTTIAIPAAAALVMIFLMSRRKRKE